MWKPWKFQSPQVNQSNNLRNDCIIVDRGEPATPVLKTKHPASVMVLGVVTSDSRSNIFPGRYQGQHRGLPDPPEVQSAAMAMKKLSWYGNYI